MGVPMWRRQTCNCGISLFVAAAAGGGGGVGGGRRGLKGGAQPVVMPITGPRSTRDSRNYNL